MKENVKTFWILKKSNWRYEFDVYRKPALRNVQIKSHCCIPSDTISSTFNRFLGRAPKISSEKHLREEIEYLIYFAKIDMVEKHYKR